MGCVRLLYRILHSVPVGFLCFAQGRFPLVGQVLVRRYLSESSREFLPFRLSFGTSIIDSSSQLLWNRRSRAFEYRSRRLKQPSSALERCLRRIIALDVRRYGRRQVNHINVGLQKYG